MVGVLGEIVRVWGEVAKYQFRQTAFVSFVELNWGDGSVARKRDSAFGGVYADFESTTDRVAELDYMEFSQFEQLLVVEHAPEYP